MLLLQHLILAAAPCVVTVPARKHTLADHILLPALTAVQRISGRLQDASETFRRKLGGCTGEVSAQPVFAGSWTTDRVENLDYFLDRALGVGLLKRKVAAQASQSQRLYQQGKTVHLEVTDRRGTMKYELRPDGRVVSGRGFMKLPIWQQCWWGAGGSLVTEERYSQHLGGPDNGKSCSGKTCPVIRSCRSVTKNGQMLVTVERTLANGETIRMHTFYRHQQTAWTLGIGTASNPPCSMQLLHLQSSSGGCGRHILRTQRSSRSKAAAGADGRWRGAGVARWAITRGLVAR